VAIGNVSGHGIPSALLMAAVRSSLRQRTSLPGGTAEIISDVNRQLVKEVEDSGQFKLILNYSNIMTLYRDHSWLFIGNKK
jgi:sigma-B regulation protein RsbU (phosphoserine phosphatase)